MSVTVDPALFRLRAFEEEWIAPLIEDAASDTALNHLLLTEAHSWVVLGTAIGYCIALAG
jgi:hypothetical protein